MKSIKISKDFKARATNAILSIVLFAFTYLLLILASVALALGCAYLGIHIMIFKLHAITFIVGVGFIALGIFVFTFTIKFLFTKSKVDTSDWVEIFESDEPQLFALINEIANEVQTKKPKKVYISSEVNASVFYNSSFWSMFIPVQKNIHIGLGLVNTVTKSEFKAILSHEFGHFSQKTMAVGSYVYNVNKIIFNLLYENDSYENAMQKLGNTHIIILFFMQMAFEIVRGMKWILNKLYEIINKNYLALSREMEFQADEIAAHITGNKPVKYSLLRLNFASQSYEEVLRFYYSKVDKNLTSKNIFEEQFTVLNFLLKNHKVTFINSFPLIEIKEYKKYDKSKLVINNQWSSHPSTLERIERVEALQLEERAIDNNPANEYFKNIIKWQEKVTQNLFSRVDYKGVTTYLSKNEFIDDYITENSKYDFPKLYNGYYDAKKIASFDYKVQVSNVPEFTELFSDEKVELIYHSNSLLNDKQVLESILKDEINVKTFDYDGVKYKKNQTSNIINVIDQELETINSKILKNDINIYKFFREKEKLSGNYFLEKYYNDYFEFDNEYNDKFQLLIDMYDEVSFFHTKTPIEKIISNLKSVKNKEIILKKEIESLLSNNKWNKFVLLPEKEHLKEYCLNDWKYFENSKYYDDNVDKLFLAINSYENTLYQIHFSLKKQLLDYQASLP